MIIDWFTVIAQVINFLILVWLLRRFLYKPVLKAIAEREKKITAQIREAEVQKKEAQKEKEDFQQRNNEFQQQRKTMFSDAEEEAETERNKLLNDARKEYENLRDSLQQTIKNEERRLMLEISRRAQDEVFAITRKLLADLADTSLEEKIAQSFISRMQKLSDEEKKKFHTLVASVADPTVFIQSGFALSSQQQADIGNLVKKFTPVNVKLDFQTAPNKIKGIELITNGYKISWSIDEYLTTIERNISEFIDGKSNSVFSANSERDQHVT